MLSFPVNRVATFLSCHGLIRKRAERATAPANSLFENCREWRVIAKIGAPSNICSAKPLNDGNLTKISVFPPKPQSAPRVIRQR
jgi:hypothetical protein